MIKLITITEDGIARIPALETMLEERIREVEQRLFLLRTDLLGRA